MLKESDLYTSRSAHHSKSPRTSGRKEGLRSSHAGRSNSGLGFEKNIIKAGGLKEKYRKGENPLEEFAIVEVPDIHPQTELSIVKPVSEKATKEHHSSLYIMKTLRMLDPTSSKTKVDPSSLRVVRKVINQIRPLDHSGVVHIYDVFEYEQNLYLILEKCDGEPIWSPHHNHYNEGEVARLIFKLLSIIRYMHDHGVVHGDLRPECSICFASGDSGDLKLVDFGLHYYEGKNAREDGGFLEYHYAQAPEALLGNPSFESDCWSVGIICYILITGKKPFHDEHDLTTVFGEPVLDFSDPVWEGKDDAKDFIIDMLHMKPERRMNATQALEHAWIQNHVERDNGQEIHQDFLQGVADHLVQYASEPKLKKAALSIMAHWADSPEIAQLRSVFEHFDEDKNGSITKDELYNALRELKVSEASIMEVFAAMDFNNDANIEYSEFLGALLEFYQEIKKKDLKEAFQQIAGEGHECITTRRLVHFFDVNLMAAQKMVIAVDHNSNGRISFDEFYHHFRKGSKTKEIREKRLEEQRQRNGITAPVETPKKKKSKKKTKSKKNESEEEEPKTKSGKKKRSKSLTTLSKNTPSNDTDLLDKDQLARLGIPIGGDDNGKSTKKTTGKKKKAQSSSFKKSESEEGLDTMITSTTKKKKSKRAKSVASVPAEFRRASLDNAPSAEAKKTTKKKGRSKSCHTRRSMPEISDLPDFANMDISSSSTSREQQPTTKKSRNTKSAGSKLSSKKRRSSMPDASQE